MVETMGVIWMRDYVGCFNILSFPGWECSKVVLRPTCINYNSSIYMRKLISSTQKEQKNENTHILTVPTRPH